MSKENTKTNLLEELYFSSGNSGLTFRVLEKISTWKAHDGTPRESIRYRVEVQHGAFGEYSTLSFPLGKPEMARHMAEALTRTVDHMESVPEAGGRYCPFDRMHPRHIFGVRGGLKARSVWREEYVTGPHSTSSDFLGTDWLDRKGNVVSFEPNSQDDGTESGSCGSDGGGEPTYYPDEIGLTLREIAERRKGTDRREVFYRKPGPNSRYVPPGVDPTL